MEAFDSAEAFHLIDRREAHGRAIVRILMRQRTRLEGIENSSLLERVGYIVSTAAVQGAENVVVKIRQGLLDRTDAQIAPIREQLAEWNMQDELARLTGESSSQ